MHQWAQMRFLINIVCPNKEFFLHFKWFSQGLKMTFSWTICIIKYQLTMDIRSHGTWEFSVRSIFLLNIYICSRDCQIFPCLPHGQSQWWHYWTIVSHLGICPLSMSMSKSNLKDGKDRSLHIRLGLGAGWLTIRGINVREWNIIWNRS